MIKEINNLNNLSKEHLKEKLVHLQLKLKKIINAENKISSKYPIKMSRLKKQTDSRLNVMKEIEEIAFSLIDKGETFRIKRKKKNKSMQNIEN